MYYFSVFKVFFTVELRIKSIFKLILILIKAEFNLIFNKVNFLGEKKGKFLYCFIQQLNTLYALHYNNNIFYNF